MKKTLLAHDSEVGVKSFRKGEIEQKKGMMIIIMTALLLMTDWIEDTGLAGPQAPCSSGKLPRCPPLGLQKVPEEKKRKSL